MVHNGVRLERFHAIDGSRLRRELTGGCDRPVVLVVARLEPQKGHRFLLTAALEVPKALFVFAGNGAERAALEQKAAQYGLLDRVRFLGHRLDAPELLASCDVVVLSSLHEGLPLSVLVPRPRVNLVLYHGVLAPRAAWRAEVCRGANSGLRVV